MSLTPRDGGPVTDPEDPTGPGAQLREARHRANLSLEEVATQLRLDRRTVRALEENEFQYLPAPTFIRGYIRSYARLLGLPPGPILEAYDYQGFTPPAILADITQGPQARFSDIPVRLATYLVAAGLVAMVIMWWHSRESTLETPAQVETIASAPGEASAPISAETAPQNTIPEETPPEPAAPPADELTAAVSAAQPVSAEPEPEPQATAAGAAPMETAAERVTTQAESLPTPPGPAERARAAVEDPQAEPAAATGTVTVREALINNVQSPPALPGRLVIRFSDQSWVEIFDADGVRREFRLATPGSSTSVGGTPPFNVLLGYAAAASVSFDGQDYDISRYIRGDTARFLIGPDGLARARPPERPSNPPESSAQAEAEPSAVPSEAAVSQPPSATVTPETN
jgi:cytoskeleton protein RodZ